MTFDPHSLEHLRQLGRKLPKELPKPSVPQKKQSQANKKHHPIETEENPQLLFQQLMKASPDGNVPDHLIARLKELETKQLSQSNNYHTNQSIKKRNNKDRTTPSRQISKGTKEEVLYASFNRFLLEDES